LINDAVTNRIVSLIISSGRTTWVPASSEWPHRTRNTTRTSCLDRLYPATCQTASA